MSPSAIFEVRNDTFEEAALDIFRFQYEHNHVYNSFCNAIHIEPARVNTLTAIPFLPISFFKNKKVVTTDFTAQSVFRSSGTTGSEPSIHYVKDNTLYRESFMRSFRSMYGDIKKWCILGLLPSYLERGDASLVFMVDELIKQSGDPASGFYLDDMQKLYATVVENESRKKQTLLIGVSYALLDFADRFPMKLAFTSIIETGGMKGRRKELIRVELHDHLMKQLGVHEIHSEYGMTELLSQAWSHGQGIFFPPPWMRILLRSDDDPFDITMAANRGVVNIIDLANYYSCSFLATDDNGKLYEDGTFEILGRLDSSDTRGCGLMWT